jgi:hypothetical protein
MTNTTAQIEGILSFLALFLGAIVALIAGVEVFRRILAGTGFGVPATIVFVSILILFTAIIWIGSHCFP